SAGEGRAPPREADRKGPPSPDHPSERDRHGPNYWNRPEVAPRFARGAPLASHLHALFGEILQRARMPRDGRVLHRLILERDVLGLGVHDREFSALLY